MSITHLPGSVGQSPTDPAWVPAAEGVGVASPGGAVGGRARSRLAVRLSIINKAITRIGVDVADEDQPATGFDVQELERAIRRLEATKLALIAKADRQQTRRHSGASSTSAWVAELTRSGGAAAARDVTLATTLDDGLPATKAAFEAGEVSRTNAGIIADTMAGLPDTLTETERATVEAHLVRDGKHLAPGRLRRVASQALAAADKSAAEVAQHEEDGLLDQERRAYARSSISMHDNGDGTTTGRFLLPTGPAHVLRKVLQSMTSPRRDHLTKDAERVISDGQKAAGDLDDGSVAAQLAAATTVGGRNADWDALSWAERQGRAFADLLEHLPTDRLTGKVASTVVVTMTLEQVQGAARAAETATLAGRDSSSVKPSVGAAQTDTGHRHSTSEARRLACGAGIVPAVLRGESVPLDLGRQERFFTEAQRTALSTCYDECAAEGCDRPYAWSELHHEDPWGRGGHTDLDLAIPLCGFHHRRIHDPAYEHTVQRNRQGIKSVRLRLRA